MAAEPVVPREIFDVAMRVMNGGGGLSALHSPLTLLLILSLGAPIPEGFPVLGEEGAMEEGDDEEEDEDDAMGGPDMPGR